MNLSSRWCVTAVVALGAVACSDPVPPASQGAIWVQIQSNSPAPAGKSCPSGTSTTYDVPHVNPNPDPTSMKVEVLDDYNYLHWIVDGQAGSTVSCSVKGGDTFTFSGRLKGQTVGSDGMSGVGAIDISNGTLDASHKGTATISLSDTAALSQSLTSPAAACTVDAATGTGNHQVKAGSIWASFTCTSVEAQPSDYCKAHGVFVLENCSQ
ncbi:MAG TPA: hypothetical protein VHB79_09215 [Polyangiaceae bacterium]|nr:hypothetical protein [Polyangiaceae bacterium]